MSIFGNIVPLSVSIHAQKRGFSTTIGAKRKHFAFMPLSKKRKTAITEYNYKMYRSAFVLSVYSFVFTVIDNN